MIKVGILLIDGFALLSYASFMEPMRAANILAGEKLFHIRHIPVYGASSKSSSGAIIQADAHAGESVDFDLVMVIAGGKPENFKEPKITRWLRHLANRNVRLGAISGGPLILANAGLMDGYRMTAHWEHANYLAGLSNTYTVEPSLYVIDRDRITCAGGNAPLDVMHVLISEEFGEDFAGRVSDWFMHTEVRPSAAAQRATFAKKYQTNHPVIILAIEAMNNHIADTLTLSQLASILKIGPRQLNRTFKENLNKSTMRFYHELRLNKARDMLLNTHINLTEIALVTGFSSSAHFSTAFSKHYTQTPRSVRDSELNSVLPSIPNKI